MRQGCAPCHMSKAMHGAGGVKLVLALSVFAVAVYLCVEAVSVRDDDDVKFLKDGIDEAHQTFQAAAAEMDGCPGEPVVNGEKKIEWPELVGKPAIEAQAVLGKEAPGFSIQTIGHDMMATTEWRCNRIRIWKDSAGNVRHPPRIG